MPRWRDFAYNSLDNTNTATANTLVDGLPVAGALSPYTKRYSKGASGEWLDAFVFANFDAGDVPVNVKAGQHTVFWGDSLLLGGAIHSVSYSQNPLDLQKGFMTPGSEAKELFRPRGGITLQAQPTNELSLAGQWFYAWQAVRIPESGSYLTIQDPLNFGGDSHDIRSQSVCGVDSRRARHDPLLACQDIKPSNWSGSLGDFGLSARWSPAWLDGTLGFYGRNTTDTLPQAMATPGLATTCRRRPAPRSAATAAGGTNCIINQNATSVAELQKFGKVGTYNTAYGDQHPHLRHHARQGNCGHQLGGRVLLPAEHAAAEQGGAGAAAGALALPGAGLDRHHGGADQRHTGCAWRYLSRPHQWH